MLQRYEKPSEYRHELETMKPEVVACYKQYCDRKTSDELVSSLRAIIGSKADTYAKIKERLINGNLKLVLLTVMKEIK